MPIKSKKDKRKKKRRFTNEEILKIIKKLKPKNQQTVRINIGDKGEKKGGVSNQPPVRSEVSYFHAPPPTPYFSPPQPPLPIHAPAPSLAETKASFKAPAQREPIEETVSRRSKERKTKRVELQPEEYEYFMEEPTPVRETFKMPDKFRQSILGAYSSQPTHYYEPIENDPFQPELIQTTQSQDQIGNRSSFNMSSDTWTLTPSGEVESLEQIQLAQPEVPVETQPTEEELIQQQADLLSQQQVEEEATALIESAQKETIRRERFKKIPNIYESSSESSYLSKELAPNITIFDVNRLVREGKINLDEFEVDPNVMYKTGKKKGELRKEVTNRELYPILQAIDKRGLVLKKTVPRTEA